MARRDKSRYCISTADGGAKVFISFIYSDDCVFARDSWGAPSIMVSGAIALKPESRSCGILEYWSRKN